ncbi:MAG: T9SS type A sorting domain-containing protein [Bacteroidetes bacterium]|nr:T9SS type A sorting domain-containing protein [Bacteroidota bacterium]
MMVKAQTWSPVSTGYFPTNVSGQINGISRVSNFKFHPSLPNKMYAVSARGGLFITNDSGNSWNIASGCDAMPNGTRFASVCVDHNNDQVIYLGTGDLNYYYTGAGVYKSTNGGLSFAASSSGMSGRMVAEILMDPINSNVLIAATDQGIYKSTNAGSSWTLKTATSLNCTQMLRKANTTSRVLFASTRTDFYQSNDFGETWVLVTTGLYTPTGYSSPAGIRIAVTPADTQLVYLAMVAKKGTIFKSTDGGLSFSVVKDSHSPNLTAYTNDTLNDGGQGNYNYMLAADITDPNIVYLGAHNFWKSTNGGSTWSQLTNWWAVLHTDMHWVRVNPYNPAQIWTANDGGVWLSTNVGLGWTRKSNGLYVYEMYHGITSPTRRDMISIGTQDNGELYLADTTWYCNRGGDWSSFCTFDYRPNSNIVYYHGNARRRAVNGGEQNIGLTQTSYNDISFYRNNTNLAILGDTAVYRTSNLLNTTPSWTKISSFNKTIRAVHINMNDSSKIYAVASDSAIYICNNAYDATPIFTRKVVHNNTISTSGITSIKGNSNIIYMTGNTRVYRSADGGITFSNISSNLPSVNWVGITTDEFFGTDELVFIAGGNYVYYKKASQTNWTLFNSGLPVRTNIQDISLFDDGTNQSILRVTTYGRGVWEMPISQLRPLLADFKSGLQTPCTGVPVQFSNISNGPVASYNWTFTGATPSTSPVANPTVVYNAAGAYDVTLTIYDGIGGNHSITRPAYINTFGKNLNVTETFEQGFPPIGWQNIDVNNDQQKWNLRTGIGAWGNSNNSVWFNNYDWDAQGRRDEFRTIRFDAVGYNTLSLLFDVAYQPYGGQYQDSLQVLVSTDCGNTFNEIYVKGGNVLSTVSGNNTSAFTPTATQWRTEIINLNAYNGNSIVLAFKNIGRFGNNLYLDNIALLATVAADAGTDKLICKGNSTTIGVLPNANHAYAWSPAASLSSSSISNPTANPIANTQYILTVTHLRSGISTTDTIQVNVDSVAAMGQVTDVACHGNASGVITQTITAGITPFSYQWSTGGSTQDIQNITQGNYAVTITDSVGCTALKNYMVSEPAAINTTGSATPTTCGLSNGALSISTVGGTGVFTYQWSNAATTNMLNNLAAATYTVTITDANACTATTTFTISASNAVLANKTQKNLTCYGNKNGWCKVAPSQGATPYMYLWNNGNSTDSIGNRIAGNYTCTITDAAGCSTLATFALTQPPQIQLTLSGTPATGPLFDNGTASVIASNGFAPYRYSWNTSPIRTTQTITGISPGTYVVTVKDNKKCARNGAYVVGSARLGSLRNSDYNIRLFPNPVSELLTVTLDEQLDRKISRIEIINEAGELINLFNTENELTIEIDFRRYASGIYILKFAGKNESFTRTLIKL